MKNITSNLPWIDKSKKLSGGFWRPEKIVWRLHLDNKEPAAYIRSKSERKKVRKLLELKDLGKIAIKTHWPLKNQDFLDWLEVYKQIIGKKDKGILRLDKNWLKQKNQPIFGVFLYEKDQFLGGLLAKEINNKRGLSVCYLSVKRFESINLTSRSILEYEFLKWGSEREYEFLGHGQDSNLYGWHLSPGVFEIKSRYGYHPEPSKKSDWKTTFFVSEKGLGDEVLLISKDKKMQVNLIYKNQLHNQNRFKTKGMKIKTWKMSDLIKKHQKALSEV